MPPDLGVNLFSFLPFPFLVSVRACMVDHISKISHTMVHVVPPWYMAVETGMKGILTWSWPITRRPWGGLNGGIRGHRLYMAHNITANSGYLDLLLLLFRFPLVATYVQW